MEGGCSDYENSSSSTDVVDHGVIREKIKSVFCSVSWSNLNGGGLIQFWAAGKHGVLSTFDEPFVSSEHSESFLAYRLCCLRCQYVVVNNNNNNNNSHHQVQVKDDMIIIPNGPAATVFVKGFPQLVVDLRHQQLGSSQLVDIALGCGLTCSLFLPIFYPHTSYCVGVVEYCSTTVSDLVPFFYDFKRLLMKAGLSTFYLQERQPYKTINCLEYATNEIEDALEIVCESHYLTAAQVWITYENENHHFPSSSSSLLDNDHMKHVFALKLIGYRVDSGDSAIKDYHDTCDTFPLTMGESGLATKTLQTNQPHFSKSITELGDDGSLLTLIRRAHNDYYSCLTICFRSIHTGDVDYVFEFLWPGSCDYLILLKSLLLTLKSCLPSFKLAPGAQLLGDELCVVDVDNSTGSGIRCFNIDLSSSPLLKPCRLRKRSVAKECVSSLDVKHNVVGISDGKVQKRKLSYLCESQMDSSEESSDESSNGAYSPDEGTLTIKAEFEEDVITFQLPAVSSAATLAAVKKEIDKAFELKGNYRLKYLDTTNMWIVIVSDEHVTLSITDRPLSSTHIRLRVIPDKC